MVLLNWRSHFKIWKLKGCRLLAVILCITHNTAGNRQCRYFHNRSLQCLMLTSFLAMSLLFGDSAASVHYQWHSLGNHVGKVVIPPLFKEQRSLVTFVVEKYRALAVFSFESFPRKLFYLYWLWLKRCNTSAFGNTPICVSLSVTKLASS